jgi:hypothetical protein
MNQSDTSLLKSIRELEMVPNIDIEFDRGVLSYTPPALADAVELYADMFGFQCPPSMRSGLLLPDTIDVRWQYGEAVAGEMQIANPLVAMHRQLDDSLLDWTLDDHKLVNMRVADQVLVNAGPFYILFEVSSHGPSEQLFLFDTRILRPMTLDYSSYLGVAGVTKSIVYWQYLYCAMRVTPAEARRLKSGVDFIAERFPALSLDDVQRRLRERSD